MAAVSEHVEWLSLVDITGLFLAPSVLSEVFPQGLEAVETLRRQRLRRAYEEWHEAVYDEDPQLEKLHEAWIEFVLFEALEYEKEVLIPREELDGNIVYRAPEHGAEVSPDFALHLEDGTPRLLVSIYPPGTDLEKPVPWEDWSASPAERMILLCRAHEVRNGIVTDGERWMLLNAPVGSTSGHASWFARLWWQEPVTLRAFLSLLGLRRWFGTTVETLDQLFERSMAFEEEVTDILGEQVRRAVEVLIQALGRIDEDRRGELLHDVGSAELYEAGLSVMMRLVFILCAEERNLLLLGDPVYDQHYAISTLRNKLQEDADHHGEEVLERRYDAWSRLLAVFRAVYGGVEHESLRLPALGGTLFDPEQFPFIEGRAKGGDRHEELGAPLPIDNRTVLLLLTALQVLEQPGGAQLLSYRALDVEQIGHVYEGLLEYTVTKLPKVTLGLVGSQKSPNPTIELDELESLQDQGARVLTDHLAEVTGRSASAIRKSLDRGCNEEATAKLVQACDDDGTLAEKIQPFSGLIRADSWDALLVYKGGSLAVTTGTTRRETGTHYTPKSLTERIVAATLEPLAYVGPAEGVERADWRLKTASELLDLKICDPAMGSGAFLVQVCRWLSERIVETWSLAEGRGGVVTREGVVREELGNADPLVANNDEKLLLAIRMVAERCIYGVDTNPLAVDLAKLSIWLVTLAKGRPFAFLDHNLRHGDSLLGIHRLDQLIELSMRDSNDQARSLFSDQVNAIVEKAINARNHIRRQVILDIQDVQIMEELNVEVQGVLKPAMLVADALVGAELVAEGKAQVVQRSIAIDANAVLSGDRLAMDSVRCRTELNLNHDLPAGRSRRTPFHWPLEFPEIFIRDDGGFNAIVGNPPFLGGQRITGSYGAVYREYLVKNIGMGTLGSADLVGYFFLHAYELLTNGGCFGLLAVNTIAEGDTRQVGLERLITTEAEIYEAYPDEVWPGKAAVMTSCVHVHKGAWTGVRRLAGHTVTHISAFLSDREDWSPRPIKSNQGKSFQGNTLLGMGFTINEEEARRFISLDCRNREVVLPYINGADLNSHPEQKASRWVVNFWDWSEEKSQSYELPFAWVREYVYPERLEKSTKRSYKDIMSRWWQHLGPRPHLYRAIGRGHAFGSVEQNENVIGKSLDRVLVTTRHSKFLMMSWQQPDRVFSDAIVVFAIDQDDTAAILSSTIHGEWVWHNASRLETRLRYTPTDCFETFPFPKTSGGPSACGEIGQSYFARRSEIMREASIGLTKLYNCFHDPDDSDRAIIALRKLQLLLDETVTNSYYGWQDIDLGHGFHSVPYLPKNDRTRYTISESARVEVLKRLSYLNKVYYEEERKKETNCKQRQVKSTRFKVSSESVEGRQGQLGFADTQGTAET